MTGWARKRFWKEVSIAQTPDGFGLALDGRAVKTPAKAALIVPTRALAQMLVAEWQAQGDVVDPATMPATRAANAAIDKVRGQKAEVAELLAAFGDSDLLCYRAEGPDGLLEREARAWDPLIDWAAHRYGTRPLVCHGVMHRPQPDALLNSMRADIDRLGVFELTAFHDLVAMSGSLIIALAALDRFDTAEALWQISRIDEDWQIEQWGADEEAAALTAGRRRAFLDAAAFYFALQG
ncbi:MAG: ATPase [Rhodobacteraceae bacterium]|nr:ATPase [Paracoccaceae bacterium]